MHRQPGPVGLPDGPIGEDVRLAPVVHALAEAAPDRNGGMKEDRLPCPPLSRADLAELAELFERRDRREGLRHLAGQQPGRIVAEPASAGQERADLLTGQLMQPGGHGLPRPGIAGRLVGQPAGHPTATRRSAPAIDQRGLSLTADHGYDSRSRPADPPCGCARTGGSPATSRSGLTSTATALSRAVPRSPSITDAIPYPPNETPSRRRLPHLPSRPQPPEGLHSRIYTRRRPRPLARPMSRWAAGQTPGPGSAGGQRGWRSAVVSRPLLACWPAA